MNDPEATTTTTLTPTADTSPPTFPRVVLKPRMARPFFARHPWVYEGSIGRVEGDPAPGDEVAVISREGQFVARGLFNPRSIIRTRLYRWEDAPLDEAFWTDRLASAVRLRTEVLGFGNPDRPCRLVFSEADGLSGLTVDRYGPQLVVQFTSLALYERREPILDILQRLTNATGVILRTEKGIGTLEGLEVRDGVLRGPEPEGPISVEEHGLTYEVDLRTGQKTGFYLDQRANRRAVAAYAEGRTMLDLFCYTGGFSLTALRHGNATHALGFDASAPAIDLARRNAVTNKLTNVRFEVSDAFDALERLRSTEQKFGLVVCDPPKFARHARGVDDALKGYLRLNRAALEVLEPGGLLATCSCSGLVDRGQFAGVLAQAAELSGRPIQFLERLGQAADHPVSASCLETEYLKCFICRVE